VSGSKHANAHSWKPGTSGNPGGRALSVTRATRAQIAALEYDFGAPVGVLKGWDALRYRLWLIGMTGEDKDSITAIRVLFERGYGQPLQKVKIEEEDAPAAFDWSKVPIEKRKSLLEAAREIELLVAPATELEPDRGPTEH
jgi:hypothetical protein